MASPGGDLVVALWRHRKAAGMVLPWQFPVPKACLLYCLSYICGDLLKNLNNLEVLLLGRVFGGLSTSLLYCSFEAWVTSEFQRLPVTGGDLERPGGTGSGDNLSTLFSQGTCLNALIAILGGVCKCATPPRGLTGLLKFTGSHCVYSDVPDHFPV